MTNWPLNTIGSDMRRANALVLLPPGLGRWDEVLLVADNLQHCDAWTGTALRLAVEYQARQCSRLFALGLPEAKPVCQELLALIGAHKPEDMPRHFCLSHDAELPDVRLPSTVVLPAQRIDHYSQADALSDILPRCLQAFPRLAANLIARGFGELVENGLTWGEASPVGVIATVAHEREAHALQVVVSDLAGGHPPGEEGLAWLDGHAAESRSALHGWAGLLVRAEELEIAAELNVAAGSARMSWRAGADPEMSAGQEVGGFTAALEVAL